MTTKKSKPYQSLYIKPTRYVHDSGFRTFEVGYIVLMEEGRVKDKIVLGTGSDHIYTDFMAQLKGKGIQINMDLTRDGYIRIWSHSGKLAWDKGHNEMGAFSSAEISLIEEEK